MAETYLRFEGITKTFPGVRALDDVSFGVSTGSVHALLGENGAGKSTLLKILSGAYQPDQGKLFLGDREVRFRRTQDALTSGVAVIYQELQLVNELSVAENLFLGHLPSHAGWLDKKAMRREAKKLLEQVGETFSPDTLIGRLPIAQRQMVEIAKALSREASVIAFDEPTSSLSRREVARLFAVIQRLKEEGKVVLYVSHRMDEIFEVCDAATVLRDGKHVNTLSKLEGVTTDDLVRLMVGREVNTLHAYRPRPIGAVALRVEGICGPGVTEPVSLKVHEGEILGVFGLVGAGRTEMVRLIAGAAKSKGGTVSLRDVESSQSSTPAPSPQHDISREPLRKRLNRGVALCPEDRKREGIVAIASVQDNLNLGVRKRFSPGGFWISTRREKENALDKIDRLRVKTPSPNHLIGTLSGGNQQKAVLGRVLGRDLKVLLLDEPTRGIDVGAKSEVHEIVRGLAESGVAVILVSSEMPELLGVCDRILVMREGRLSGELNREGATQERLLELALPVSTQ